MESLYDQSPQPGKQKESKVAKPQGKQQASATKRNSKIYFKTFGIRFRSPDKMLPPFKQPLQMKIRVKRREKEMGTLKRFLFQKNRVTSKAYEIFRNKNFKKSNVKHWPKEQIHLYISNNNTKHLCFQIQSVSPALFLEQLSAQVASSLASVSASNISAKERNSINKQQSLIQSTSQNKKNKKKKPQTQQQTTRKGQTSR